MARRTSWSWCAIAIGLMAGGAHAQTIISQWNFNSPTADGNTGTGVTTPSTGAGTALTFGGITTSFSSGDANGGSTDPNVGDDSGWQTTAYAAQGAENGGRGLEFSVSTANFTGIIVKWDQRHSNTSSRFVQLYYSTNGTTFTAAPGGLFEATLGGDTWYNERTVDLSAIAAANNNASFKIRIAPVFDPASGTAYTASTTGSTYAGTGTLRYDMVTVSGTPATSIPPSGTGVAVPGAVCAGGGVVNLQVTVVPGLNPASTGVTVSADLTSIGGAAAVPLLDSGTDGDAMIGDNIYSFSYTVPGSVTIGQKTIPVSINDTQNRPASTSIALTVADCSGNSGSQVVISQVFGGGANAGPPLGAFNADFVELFNRSNVAVDLTGWSVQYASSANAGGFDSAANQVLLSGTIQPGQHRLIQYSLPGAIGASLPTPDFTNTSGMGNTGGRVALVRTASLIGATCNDANVEDLVGYGAAACFEGAGAAGVTANDTAAVRKLGGAQDTNQNFNDFLVGTPAPHNRSFGGFLAGYGSLSASSVCAGSQLGFTVNVTAATTPASTGILVRANLTQLNGAANQALIDNGGGLYTLNYTVPVSVPQGRKLIPITVTDVQGRTDTSSLSVDVGTCNSSSARVVISGFLGGGGNVGAPFDADFVELFNRSSSTVDLTGWSVQYANADSAVGFLLSQTIPLSGAIAPGKYLLVRTSAVPGLNGVPIPTPDFFATPAFGMDNASGRIAVVRIATPLANNCASPDIEDLVGYGALASCFEGLASTADISNTVGGYRKLDGCQDFNQNAIDFDIIAPINLPRNSASPANPCVVIPVNGACCCGSNCAITTAAGCTGSGRTFAGAGTVCAPISNTVPCCRGDYNKTGAPATVQDIFDFLTGYFGNNLCADTNDSGGISVQDIFDFLSAYFGGGC